MFELMLLLFLFPIALLATIGGVALWGKMRNDDSDKSNRNG